LTLPKNFEARIEKREQTARPDLGPCWIWTGSINVRGYGKFATRYVHRLSFEHFKGVVPVGLELDHLCREHACCNPDHLEAVTHQENVRRGRLAEANRERAIPRTHCRNGHAYVPENIMFNATTGRRQCLTCAKKNRAIGNAKIAARRRAARECSTEGGTQ
jgi:HNH endonuclease